MMNDARHALRLLHRSPGFTATAVATLAVGIGATTGVYSIYNAVLLKPLPFAHPERIVSVFIQQARGGVFGISGGTLTAVRALPTVDRAAVTIGVEQTLLDRGDPEILRGALVTGEFFGVFGVAPAIGRILDVTDSPAESRSVVVSHRLWHRRFGADAGLIGQAVRFGDTVHTIVGVMPASFRYPDDAEYWMPYRLSGADLADFGSGAFTGVARLKDVDIRVAASQAAVLGASSDIGTDGVAKVLLVPLLESMAGPHRSNLGLLLGAVTMLLLISCFNVANLLIAHATARERELAIRGAIGASRRRLLRQFVAESAIVATGGALAGLALAQLIVMSLPALGTLDIPRLDEATLDWRVLAFAVAAATGSVCIFGILPPWLVIRRMAPALGAGRTIAGPRHQIASQVLIALQIAATLALLVGSALVLRSLYGLHHVDVGFDTSQLTVTTIRPSATMLKQLGGIAFYERIVGRLRDYREFESVAVMSHVPLERVLATAVNLTTGDGLILPEGRGGPRMRVLSPGGFETLGIPIVNGRDFQRTDRDGAPLVTMVNETLAQKLWGSRDPVGESLIVESRGTKRSYRVIGVARDFRTTIQRVPQPEVYLPSTQELSRLKLVVRSTLPPEAVAARVREVILSEDPQLPIAGISTVNGLVWEGTAHTRFHAVLLTSFGAFAALLASSGILAVVMYTVARRTREIGIRVAIGAAPRQVVMLLMREMTPALLVGLATGLLAIYNLAYLLQRQGVLFEVSQSDPTLYWTVTVALSGLALFAVWLPAHRAGRVEPMVALRSE
jgi:putative ABC transport system permease protein